MTLRIGAVEDDGDELAGNKAEWRVELEIEQVGLARGGDEAFTGEPCSEEFAVHDDSITRRGDSRRICRRSC